MNLNYLNKLRIISIIEGVSTLVLFFIAMPLKYLAGYAIAVKIAGSLHGLLFVIMVITVAIGIIRVPIGARLGIAAIIGAIIPFGPFFVDKYLKDLESK